MGDSTAQNTEFAKQFHAGANLATPGGDDADGFVKFDHAAWQAWDTAIQTFIDDIDEVKTEFDGYGDSWGSPGTLISTQDTKTLLLDTMPEEAKDSIDKYREYLVELKAGIKAAYDNLNKADGN